MENPDDPREDLIEKLGRMEDEVRLEESSNRLRLVVIVYVIIAILFGICVVTAIAAEPEVIEYTDHKGSGVQFTRPDGTKIYVNPRTIAFVRDSLSGEHGTSTIVFSSGAKQAVKETVHEVIEAIHKDMPYGGDPP